LDFIAEILGLYDPDLTALQMAARAFILFFVTLILIRVAGLRTLGKQSAFDTLTLFMLAGVMSRAIVTEQSFGGSLLAATVLVLLHRLIAYVSFKNKKIGYILKGGNILLLKNGKKLDKNLLKTHVTDEDIEEAIRKEINCNSLGNVEEVNLERSGYISITKKENI
jgi:uncharacterized membrane protein YcaP (DUF421 family)